MDGDWGKDPLGGHATKVLSSSGRSDGYTMHPGYLDDDESPARIQRFFEGFKRDPRSEFYSRDHIDPEVRSNIGPYYDLRRATADTAQTGGLMRRLKGRHLQMIAIGGSVVLFTDKSLFFSYAIQWLSVLPLEVIAASLTIQYWNDSIARSIFVTVFLIFILAINMFGVKGHCRHRLHVRLDTLSLALEIR
ncbi:hypothetical protein NQ176_g8346 [Zarea fungicola]|uniref:Uncharacterized protein n=1 Tax=Zarea fungicola TaxID=93591 RepID=A0ACC1MUR9_9HYPO|nr:hypothetical protein NQ176_g8346 [Lecanicillium fungicola]